MTTNTPHPDPIDVPLGASPGISITESDFRGRAWSVVAERFPLLTRDAFDASIDAYLELARVTGDPFGDRVRAEMRAAYDREFDRALNPPAGQVLGILGSRGTCQICCLPYPLDSAGRLTPHPSADRPALPCGGVGGLAREVTMLDAITPVAPAGTCPRCGALVPLDGAGRIDEHRPSAPHTAILCDGAGRYP